MSSRTLTGQLADQHVVLLAPKPPCVRWIQQQLGHIGTRVAEQTQLPPEVLSSVKSPPPKISKAFLEGWSVAYLVRCDGRRSLQTTLNRVDRNFLAFFTRELQQWAPDRIHWPEPLTLPLFHQWFSVRVVDTALDVELPV